MKNNIEELENPSLLRIVNDFRNKIKDHYVPGTLQIYDDSTACTLVLKYADKDGYLRAVGFKYGETYRERHPE